MSSEFLDVLNTAVEQAPEVTALALGSKGLSRVVGPSLDAIGSALGKFTAYRAENLLKIGEKAQRRLDQLEQAEAGESRREHIGSAHPRVAKAILDEGSWIDDDLHQEYLAGLLVDASTVNDGRDDSGYLARLVGGLTADQVLLHYLMVSGYAGYWQPHLRADCPFPFGKGDQYRQHGLRVEIDEMAARLPQFDRAAKGLRREGLLQDFGYEPGQQGKTTGLVPTPLAFDVFGSVFAPGADVRILMLSRETANANLAHLGKPPLGVPDEAPPPLRTAQVLALAG